MHGEWPRHEIDHINGDPSDNRICNLRDVTHKVNGLNQKIPAHNKSGIIGVSWHNSTKKWAATITVSKKQLHLGVFDTIEQARDARSLAERKYGFHKNHGRVDAT